MDDLYAKPPSTSRSSAYRASSSRKKCLRTKYFFIMVCYRIRMFLDRTSINGFDWPVVSILQVVEKYRIDQFDVFEIPGVFVVRLRRISNLLESKNKKAVLHLNFCN
ncbi:hypothetical protein E3N88_43968 [Mikania micrantha]|uniref:Uncharacterized protein n=1 Tax=Mikania micrantha TaxID=192012 RepID=A0A5N6LDF1_9ASTR|nr:hypothetical protein E3N88_43968 [Mikania micrantha]